jgi:hypothetical protein
LTPLIGHLRGVRQKYPLYWGGTGSALGPHCRVALHVPLTVTPNSLAVHEKVPLTEVPVPETENVPVAMPRHSPETVRLAEPAASTDPDSDVIAPVAVPAMLPSVTVRVTDPLSVPYG